MAVLAIAGGDWQVSDSIQRFRSALRKGYKERRREAFNHGMVDGTFNRQWLQDQRDVQRMASEGKTPTSINITKQAINSIAGNLILDGYDASYSVPFGANPSFGEIFQELYNTDEEMDGWGSKFMQYERNGLIYRGAIGLRKDYRQSELPRLGLDVIPPERIIYDPDWSTADVNHNRRIFTWSYMSAQELKWLYGKNPKVRAAIEQRVLFDKMRLPGQVMMPVIPFDNSPEFRDEIDSTYLVINEYWLEEEEVPKLFHAASGTFLDHIPEADREEYAHDAHLAGHDISLTTGKRKVEKIRVTCPSISTAFQMDGGDYELQLDGYHFTTFVADHIMGHPNSPVDQMGEINRMINWREARISSILGSSGTNQRYIETGAAEKHEVLRFKREANIDGTIFEFKPGSASRHAFGNLPTNTPPNNFEESSNKLWDYFRNGISPAVPAFQGISKSGDSGSLYHAQVSQAVVSLVFSKGFLKGAMLDFHNKYISAARQTYTYPMTIFSRNSDKVYFINMPGVEGNVNIEEIPRVSVEVTENPSSQTRRSQVVQEMMQSLPAIPDAMTKQAIATVIVKNLPNISEEDRDSVVGISAKALIGMNLDLDISIAQKQATLKSLKDSGGQPSPPSAAERIGYTFKGEDLLNPDLRAIAAENGLRMPQQQPQGAAPGGAAPGGAAPGGAAPGSAPMPLHAPRSAPMIAAPT